MTDKEYRLQKKRVQKYMDKWFDAMGMGWFHIDITWQRDRDSNVSNTVAKTISSWQYRKAEIIWFVPAVVDNDDEFLEGIVAHEFTHVLLSPLLLVDNEPDLPLQHEYATECVARAIQWARKAGKKDK